MMPLLSLAEPILITSFLDVNVALAQVVWSLVCLVSQALVDRWLEASHVFYWEVVRVTCLQIFVQNSKDLRVQHLEPSDAIAHPLQLLNGKEEDTYKCLGQTKTNKEIKTNTHTLSHFLFYGYDRQ